MQLIGVREGRVLIPVCCDEDVDGLLDIRYCDKFDASGSSHIYTCFTFCLLLPHTHWCNLYMFHVRIKHTYNNDTLYLQSSPADRIRLLTGFQATFRMTPSCAFHYNMRILRCIFVCSKVSSPLDRSKRFTLYTPWQTCSFRHQFVFSGKHSSHAAIRREEHTFTFFHLCL